MRGAALALAVIVGANAAAGRAFHSVWPPPDSVRLTPEQAVQVAGLMSLGMRRLAADLEFVRLLVYYGSPEARGEDDEEREEHGGRPHHHLESGPRSYPEIAARAMRILDIDPYFRYAAEYAAAALAFNLHRPQDAVAVLRHALARDPKNWKYHAYLAAVAFDKKGLPDQVRRQLAPLADDPNAPTMLKHMLAYLNLTQGRRQDALRLYREIAASRDKDYAALAHRALRRLGAEAP